MDLSRFITTKYWFDTAPSTEVHNLKLWLIFFGLLTLFGALTFFNRFIYIKLRKKAVYFLLTTGLLGLVLLFFRTEGIYLVSMRLFFLILAIISLVWFLIIVKYLAGKYPKELAEIQKYRKFSAYLPKKKK